MVEEFTKRENEIAKHLALGKSEKMIADELCIGWDTVHTHTRNMRKKINGNNSVDIVRHFILNLKDPKQYFAALGFLVIHVIIIVTGLVIDARSMKVARLCKREIEMISTRGRFTRNRRLC